MQSTRKRTRSTRLRKLFKIHTLATAIALGVYFLVAFFDPGFLSYDIRQKYHALADEDIVVTATVLAPPVQPVVTAVSVCDENTGTLSVELDWADDVNTYTYDIERDSLPLVSGLTASAYSDTLVALNTAYQYVVTANGPMGPGYATSDPVLITTLSECEITAVALTVTIVSFAGRGISSYDGMPSVSDRRPTFSGTTNIPNATMQVVIGITDSMAASFSANVNGYWEWEPPTKLTSGRQLFTVTAIDPDDVTRQATTSLRFGIKKRDDDTSGKEAIFTTDDERTPSGQPSPIDFVLAVENQDKQVWQSEPVHLFFLISNLAEQYQNVNVPIRFSIVDARDNVIVSITREELLRRGLEIRKILETPAYIATGQYSLQAEVLFDHVNVSRTETFLVTELPLISLGGGLFLSYAEIMRNLGWIVLVLLALLLLWLFLFLREYGMSLYALRHIAEQQLKKAGFLTKRKGAIR